MLNQKGGVGKTTTVANAAAALAAMGSRVVAIDLDPQAHLTIHLGLEPDTVNPGTYRVLTQNSRFEEEIMMSRMNLWLLPSNIDLVGAETELVNVVGREIILREALEPVQDRFDYCLIDCSPSLGLLSLNALAAAQEVLIPLQPHFLALQGFGKLLQTIDLVNKRINPELKVKGILLCMYDTIASLSGEVRSDIEQFLEQARGTRCAWAEAEILPVHIRRNIKLAEAPSYGKTIYEYEQHCHGAEDYMGVARHIHGVTKAEQDVLLGDRTEHISNAPLAVDTLDEVLTIATGAAPSEPSSHREHGRPDSTDRPAESLPEATLPDSQPVEQDHTLRDLESPADSQQDTTAPHEIRPIYPRRRKKDTDQISEQNLNNSADAQWTP